MEQKTFVHLVLVLAVVILVIDYGFTAHQRVRLPVPEQQTADIPPVTNAQQTFGSLGIKVDYSSEWRTCEGVVNLNNEPAPGGYLIRDNTRCPFRSYGNPGPFDYSKQSLRQIDILHFTLEEGPEIYNLGNCAKNCKTYEEMIQNAPYSDNDDNSFAIRKQFNVGANKALCGSWYSAIGTGGYSISVFYPDKRLHIAISGGTTCENQGEMSEVYQIVSSVQLTQ